MRTRRTLDGGQEVKTQFGWRDGTERYSDGTPKVVLARELERRRKRRKRTRKGKAARRGYGGHGRLAW